MLPEPWINIALDFTSIINTFQNLSYIGELRQRWEEIKKLQIYPAVGIDDIRIYYSNPLN